MHSHKLALTVAASIVLAGCSDPRITVTGLSAAYVLEPGTYRFELDGQVGTATVITAEAGQPLVFEVDLPAAEISGALPFEGRPQGGWAVRITFSDTGRAYEMWLERRVVSEFANPNHCTLAEWLERGQRVPCRFFAQD